MARVLACGLVACPATVVAQVEPLEVGLTAGGEVIRAVRVAGGRADARTVLVLAGLTGEDEASGALADEVAAYARASGDERPVHLLAIPAANPGAATLDFPPLGTAYREHAEAHALWRWIGLRAPDLVLVVGDDPAGLTAALASEEVAGVGAVPAAVVEPQFIASLPADLPRSDARARMDRRLARPPLQVARTLAPLYGQSFDPPIYIPGMALVAHLRLGDLQHVERLVAPYVEGVHDSLAGRRFGLSLYLAGHLVFAELAERTGDPAYLRLARAAADVGFAPDGSLLEAMPEHGEMSDSIFMGASILAAVGSLTGEPRYFDMAARHIAFMNTLLVREDGLYRHSPLTDAAWGRGNGFAALGLALTLSKFPADHAQRARLLAEYRSLMQALARWQQEDGAWRQVIDHAGAYAETSATAIIGFSMLRGMRMGWLDADEFAPRVERAWLAVSARTGSDGTFIDVSESTNKQPTLQDYLQRAALFGRDERTGGMVMLFATELAEASAP